MGAKKKEAEERYLSTRSIADQMDLSSKTVRRWIESGALKAICIGKDFRILESDWQDFKLRHFKKVN